MSRIKGLKMTEGRIRMLTALCEPGAFAYPAGEIANEDGRRRVWRITELGAEVARSLNHEA